MYRMSILLGLACLLPLNAVEHDPWRGAVDEKGVTIDPNTLPTPQYIWEADRPDTPQKSVSCRIVEYGDDKTAYEVGYADTRWRQSRSPMVSGNPHAFLLDTDVDVDGDGKTSDDYVHYMAFSMEEHFSAPQWPYSSMLPNHINGTFYGGATVFAANSPLNPKRPAGLDGGAEIGVNPGHTGPYNSLSQENHPINAKRVRAAGAWMNAYWSILWKKEDFLNGGDQYPVTFDDSSRIASVIGRGYWWGIDQWRYIIKDGEAWYISDMSFCDLPKKFALNAGFVVQTYHVRPNDVTWASYTPQENGYQIKFDAETATFSPHTFTDIQAVGWYIGKNNKQETNLHCKWYSFACDAVVQQPAQPSLHLKTARVEDGTQPAFDISTTEIPYHFWKKIFRWANAAVYTFETKYNFDKKGDMGSMRYGHQPHEQTEPVTNVTFYDVLAWCNGFSEMEGKEPCYYTDAALTIPFRHKEISTMVERLGPDRWCNGENLPFSYFEMPTIYVKWQADGWRLPTSSEWVASSEGEASQEEPTGTSAVGTGGANSKGLYNTNDNVREFVWMFGDSMPPNPEQLMTYGADFHSAAQPVSASDYGDTPWNGAYNIGFRPLCRAAGLAAPVTEVTQHASAWTFTQNERIAARKEKSVPASVDIPLVEIAPGTFESSVTENTVHIAPFAYGKTELTYAQWVAVQNWAEANGYTFTVQGDMGSMYIFDFPHKDDEPVTNIDWHDAIVWCNAYSEMMGLKPLYYTDVEKTQVYRQAHRYRPLRIQPAQYSHVNKIKLVGMDFPNNEIQGHEKHVMGTLGRGAFREIRVYTDWSADGFRLPTYAEYEYVVRAGTNTKYYWGNKDTRDQERETVWGVRNAGGRTHSVASKQAHPSGIHDLLGNVYEFCFGNDGSDNDLLPLRENVVDPKGNVNWMSHSWSQLKKYCRLHPRYLLGTSWCFGEPTVTGQHGAAYTDTHHNSYYEMPDLGFRIAQSRPAPHITIDGQSYRVIGPAAASCLKKKAGETMTLAGEIKDGYFITTAAE